MPKNKNFTKIIQNWETNKNLPNKTIGQHLLQLPTKKKNITQNNKLYHTNKNKNLIIMNIV